MKKLYMLLIILLLNAITIRAQITMTQASHGIVPGDAYNHYFGDTTGFNPGAGGANVTWTFSGWTIIPNLTTISYVDPASTPYASSFPTATFASNDEGSYSYYRTSTAGYYLVGIADSTISLPLPDDEKINPYPLTYNTNSIDYFSGSVTKGGIKIARNGKVTTTGDGWGKLVVNGKTYNNVLRVKIFQEMSDYQISVSGGDTVVAIHYKMTSYLWYNASSKHPLINYMEIKMWLDEVSGDPYLITKEIFVDKEVTGINDNQFETLNFDVYPNPVSDIAGIESKLSKPQKLNIEIISSNGQVLYSEDVKAGTGVFHHNINVSTLPKGIYTLKIINDELFGVRKLIIQ